LSSNSEKAPAPSAPPTDPDVRVSGEIATMLAIPSPSSPPVHGATETVTIRDAPVQSRRLIPGALLGAGGMGEVYRVRDHGLHRVLAMKVLLPDLASTQALRDRFLEEAQVTAQLAHPGVPPVHEVGELDDGRPYFTMKEVHGITLAQVIEEAHRDPLAASKWNEQRRLEIFHRVCEAVAYAHARGVVHCDLKPLNVMVGAFGEVLVMDWGVARLVSPSGDVQTREPPVMLGAMAGLDAVVAGTPAYMSPEQAMGRADLVGVQADVYALGVMLFELLAGERPYRGNAREMVEQARRGVVPPLPPRTGSTADEALYSIITTAMAADPAKRYRDAKAMADDLARWREGAVRREKALAIVANARAMMPTIQPTFAKAAELRDRAARALAGLAPDAPVEAKEPLWQLEDEAAKLARDAELSSVESEQLLFNALAQAPELPEAKALIADLLYHRHADAERRRAWDEAARHEIVLRKHDIGTYADYLAGAARLALDTEPKCRVKLHRWVRRGRRMIPELDRELGDTLLDTELPVGSYLLELVADDRPRVWYPIVLRRRGGWGGTRPGDTAPFKVRLPRAPVLDGGEIFIADGCCELGGDDRAIGAHREDRAWVEAFIIREHPVTFAELSVFLAEPDGERYRRSILRDGLSVWRHDWPAVGVSWDAARAYAQWLARRTGKPWRLPTEIEWEKAARGVDGRFFPWGDFGDAAFAHARTIELTPQAPVSIDAFPLDRSPYGVRGLGGNVRDWCLDAGGAPLCAESGIARMPRNAETAAEHVVRGGSFRMPPDAARVAARSALPGSRGYPDVGMRLVRSFTG
jgi:eukaryotic-like serine/threonine-protein kinase